MWIETMGNPVMERVVCSAITNDNMMRLARQLARISNQAINLRVTLLA